MEIIERNLVTNDWITLSFLIGFSLLALMKLYKSQLLLGYSIAFFTQGFIEKRSEKTPSIFKPFPLLLISFSVLIISLTVYLSFYKDNGGVYIFLLILACVFMWLVVRLVIDFLIVKVLDIKDVVRYFFYTKFGYLHTLSIWLFPTLILHYYWFENTQVLFFIGLMLLLFRFFLIVKNNKKIVFGYIFYFILYFCTLEIAPLLILYKTTTTT